MAAPDVGLGDQTAGFTDTTSGDRAFRIFGSHDLNFALVEMSRLAYAAIAARPDIAAGIRGLLQGLEADLVVVAQETATRSVEFIRAELIASQKRPDSTRSSIHLRDAIVSTPFRFGSVKIALLAELEKVVNVETGYGPYWRAIEYGSAEVGNVMTGRVLFGRFSGPGHDATPAAEYAGASHAPGGDFIFGSLAGGTPGYGTITHEIQGTHFLAKGSEQAALYYGFKTRDLSRKYARAILALAAA